MLAAARSASNSSAASSPKCIGKALASDIIVVNHHLFFADLAMRDQSFGAILPEYAAVIFDEAHEIEDVAGQYFGMSVSNLQVQELVKDTAAVSRRKLFAAPELDRSLVQLGERSEDFFRLFPHEGRQGFPDREGFLARHETEYREFLLALETLCGRLELVDGAVEDTLPLVRRAKLIQQGAQFWMESTDMATVYWVEARGRGLYLQATPIDVSQVLAARLFDQVESVVLTSATLAVAGGFEYTQTRLGLPDARTQRVESQYDYAKQVVLYVPRHLPDPRQPDFARAAGEVVEQVIEASRGRAFVLFTSYHQMRQVYELLKDWLDYPVLLQGDAPRNALLEAFRSSRSCSVRHLELLAGNGCARRAAQLRHHRPAAVCRSDRSGDRGARRSYPPGGRQRVLRLSGSAGGAGSEAGLWKVDSGSQRSRRVGVAWIIGLSSCRTGVCFSTACRRIS